MSPSSHVASSSAVPGHGHPHCQAVAVPQHRKSSLYARRLRTAGGTPPHPEDPHIPTNTCLQTCATTSPPIFCLQLIISFSVPLRAMVCMPRGRSRWDACSRARPPKGDVHNHAPSPPSPPTPAPSPSKTPCSAHHPHIYSMLWKLIVGTLVPSASFVVPWMWGGELSLWSPPKLVTGQTSNKGVSGKPLVRCQQLGRC